MKENIVSVAQESSNQPFAIELTGISYCDGSYRIKRIKSEITCMEYIISGTGSVEADGEIFHPSEGDIYILPQGIDHIYYSDSNNPWIKIWFNIRGNLVSELFQIYGLSNVYHVKGLNIFHLFQKFLFNAQTLPNSEIIKTNAIIFHKIVQEISLFLKKDTTVSKEAMILKDYIDNNIDKNISIEALSKLVFRSKSQVSRMFKSAFGITPYEYALNKKIETSKLLLKNTNMMIKEISYKLNFADEHYFSNIFKQKTGKTPKEYKKNFF